LYNVLVAAVDHEPVDDTQDGNGPEGPFVQIPIETAETEFVVGLANFDDLTKSSG